ncbi:zinc finger domain-containing protein [Streptomyces cylindrosporus]|uniref:DNA-binding phage zinc finger domain-containing protein n=1 Tax=Streptomyces cylindrosporus TaxID=2927583 RepID=A0ABS9YL36_9ACTN|nr:hypothetical protein [Streptomyces cylindrosporus]MCI3277619.1 hypothetical protein [Streptomyces cylindrosporus]
MSDPLTTTEAAVRELGALPVPIGHQQQPLRQLIVACPFCHAEAGENCSSHGGARIFFHTVHQARTAAWNLWRFDSHPAAKLVADAAKDRTIRHARHAADLLAEHGYSTEADTVRAAVKARKGHMSAHQAAQLLLANAEGGEPE